MKRFLMSIVCLILSLSLLPLAVACNSQNQEKPTDAKPQDNTEKKPQASEDSTQKPTEAPTEEPSDEPTEKPTEAPTEEPSDEPTEKPTEEPSDKPTEKPTEAPQRPVVSAAYSLVDDNELFKTYGRVQLASEGLVCDFTASGIEFSGYMKGTVEVEIECDADTYFTVYIDGERVEERLFADKDTQYLTIADLGDEPAEHTIRFLKQTEPQWSLMMIKNVILTGYIENTPEDRDFYIEFIGDSLTTGYGNLGNSKSEDPGTAIWQDGTQSYAFIASEALNADYTIAACSGIGIDKGWTSFSMCDFYPCGSYYRSKTKDHFDARVPDLIVINLGTNDNDRGSKKDAFCQGVIDLILDLRESYNTDVPIIWAYHFGGDAREEWAFEAIESLGGESYGIYTLKLEDNRYGANGHPNLEGHYTAAEILTKFIEDNYLLG